MPGIKNAVIHKTDDLFFHGPYILIGMILHLMCIAFFFSEVQCMVSVI